MRRFSLFIVYFMGLFLLGGGFFFSTQQPVSAQPASCTVNTYLLNQNFAVGNGGFTWSKSSGNSLALWAWNGPLTQNVWYGSAPGNQADTRLQSPVISIPEGVTQVYIRFEHSFSLENRYDGGQAQLAVDGGTFNLIQANAFIENGYNQTIRSNAQSAIAGQPAFSGLLNTTWRWSTADISSMVTGGQNLQLGFRIATDVSTGTLWGWQFKRVQIGYCDGAAPAITSPNNVTINLGESVNHTFTASGVPTPVLSYSNNTLPSEITFTGNTISGTPTAIGTYTVEVDADNALGNAGQTFTLNVVGTAPTITSSDTANTIVGDAFNHTFTATGNPAPTFSYSAENLPLGVTRTGDTLSGSPTAAGTYTINVTATNGVSPDATQTLTIHVTGDAPLITSADTAAGVVGMPFSHNFTAVGNPVPVLSYSAENLPPGVTRTGDTLSGTPLASGTYTIDVLATNGVSPDATQTLTITVTGEAPVIQPPSSIVIDEKQPFTHTFEALGNPVPVLSYSAENLPPGVTRTGDTLSGTPMVDGTYSITVTASNGVVPSAQMVFTIIVTPEPELPPPPPTPLCEAHNFDEGGIVRSSTSDALGYAINCRVLYQNGSPTTWLGNDLYHIGSIGIEGLEALGIHQAVDIFSPTGMNYFEGGAVFCVRGSGTLIWLAASQTPRHPEIIGSYTVPDFPNFTCATLFEPGTLVLVSQTPR